MRKKRLLAKAAVLCLLVMLGMPAFSQNSVVTGKIADSTGAPLVGASVTILGSSRGTTTDANGVYHLTIAPGDKTLVVSAVGYTSRQIPIGNSSLIVLSTANSNLNEVVVIGYGTQLKKDLTGSVTSVNAKDFQQGAITSPDQLIAGKVAGVSVTSNGGQPGASSTIRIRGLSSLNSNNDPLIVLDGVELPASTNNPTANLTVNTYAGVANPLDYLNPDDIENVTILKDAAAEAIYGSRASAGVIIITTKKGRGGRPVYNFNTNLTVGTVAKYLPVLNAGQLRAYVNGQVAANPADTTYADMMGSSNTDWQKVIFQTALTNNDNLSISGAAHNLPYRISVGYHDEQGILKTDFLQRGTVGIHLAPHLLDDHLKIELNLNGTFTQSRFANQAAIGDAVSFDPTQSPYQKGSPYGGYFEWVNAATGLLEPLATRNPLATLEQYKSIGKTQASIGNIHFDYQLPWVPGLHAIADLGYQASTGYGTVVVPPDAAQNYNGSSDESTTPVHGLNQKYKTNNTYVTATYELNYVKDLKSIKSNINAVGLYSYTNTATTLYNYTQFSTNGDTLSGTVPETRTNPAENTLISYVGRLIYTFDQKYILTASIRDDGSSRFGQAYRWGQFPAVALAWRIKQESFLSDVSWLSDLKIRASYGKTGNQDGLLDYEYVPSYALSLNNSLYRFGNTYYNTYAPAAFDANFQWEQTTSTNLGLDFGLFNGRITGTIDVYQKNISNLFNTVPIPVGTNFTNELTVNVGTMTDKGAELNINATPIRTRNFSWDLNFNFAYNYNKITKLNNGNEGSNFYGDATAGIAGGTGNMIEIQTVGYAANSFYVLQQAYGKNGVPLEGVYVDRNRDGQITIPPSSPDAYHDHSPFAPVIMGFSSTFNYRKWSLTLVARADIGNFVYNNVKAGLGVTEYILNPLNFISNASPDIYKSHFYSPQYYSDYYVENASFMKMDNIGIGYNVGKIPHFTNLRLSANCQNVFVITKYTGQDPEATLGGTAPGVDNNLYPRPRNFTIGANLGF
jgi:TonB-dependent starch-binding outer membrane protein SusC